MADRETDILPLLSRVIGSMEHLQNTGAKENLHTSIVNMDAWEWAQGVGLYGIEKYYEATGDPGAAGFLADWFDRQTAAGLPPKNVNTVCPMLTMTYVYERTGRAEYLAKIREWAEWVMTEMPRTREGGLQHVTYDSPNEQQLWVDTLFMTVLFLTRAGRLLGRQEWVDESVRQFLLHIKYLTDRASGLWFHGWSFITRDNLGSVRWARGNCWYTAGVVDYLDMAGGIGGGVRRALLDTLRAQAEALRACQAPDGMWHTVLDDPASYEESSGTAGFAYGILKAVRLGYLPEKFRACGLHACDAVIRRINAEGVVGQVSYGTAISRDVQRYKQVPIRSMTYGQALAVLMLTERLPR